jgi:CubicO group peptidase (beta-lactamase class C family)
MRKQARESRTDRLQGLDPHHALKGIVILRNGSLISEHYFNGDSASTLYDIRSATKSITSQLMGLALQHGLVQSGPDTDLV